MMKTIWRKWQGWRAGRRAARLNLELDRKTEMRKATKLWTCGDGTKVRICDMSDRHLTNAIAFCERRAEEERAELSMHFPCFNGEMAQFFAEQEYDQMLEATTEDLAEELFERYPDLVEERLRRLEGARHG